MKSDGLSYFPLDVGYFKDDRIRRLCARFGADGPLFYVYVLCRAYENGYYVEQDEDFIEDAAIYVGCGPDKIRLILDYLLSRSLLISISLSTVKAGSQPNRGVNKSTVPITVSDGDRSCGQITVITSHGIQMQYQASIKGRKRDIVVNQALWILSDSETEGFIKVQPCENKSGNYPINPGIKQINPGEMPQSKVNESKGKEIKEKYRNANKPQRTPRFSPPSVEEVAAYCAERRNGVDPQRFVDYYTANGWRVGKSPMKDWKAAVRTWERNDTCRSAKPKESGPSKSLTFWDVYQDMVESGEVER